MRTLGALLVVLTAASAIGACGERLPSTRSPPPVRSNVVRASRPPLLVTIVVDQLAAWIAAERWPRLAADGGFRRLTREGTWVKTLRYAHAVTDTAPGHAALYTGAVPRESGIFGNETIDQRRDVWSVMRDPATAMLYPGSSASAPVVSSSAVRLRVDTVADRLRSAHPDAWVVSLSIKDRAAILPAGKRPTSVVWFDTKLVRFVTSTAFARELPAWVERWGAPTSVMRALEPPWERVRTMPLLTPDEQPGEGDESGLGTTFPHRMASVSAPGRVFRTLPAADEALLGMALDALDASDATDARATNARLLEISLSAHDYVGHVFGPDSWEAWDELARIDRALASFFSELDRRYGSDGWSAMLSGDHGTTTMPEAIRVPGVRHWCNADSGARDVYERPCGDAHRVDLDDLSTAIRAAVDRVFSGKTDLVRGLADPYVFVGEDARTLTPSDRAKLDGAVRSVLDRTPGVRHVFAIDSLPLQCPPIETDDALADDDRIAALVCRSVPPKTADQSGGYFVVTQPGSFFDPRIVRGFGTSHGTPYLYDRTVPLLVRAPGRVAAARVIDEVVDFRAFARTASALLGVAPPAAAAPGRDLTH